VLFSLSKLDKFKSAERPPGFRRRFDAFNPQITRIPLTI